MTIVGTRNYNFSSLNLGVSATTGIQGAIHVRSIRYALASGFQWVAPRPWEWFEFYYLNNPVPSSGPPTNWAQHRQGSAGTGTGSGATGTFYLDAIPDVIYTLHCDAVCYPIPLVDDTTVEALPYLWTDAVPYFAAYLALLSSQTGCAPCRRGGLLRILPDVRDACPHGRESVSLALAVRASCRHDHDFEARIAEAVLGRGRRLMPATLNTYLQDVQRLLRDMKQELLNPQDLISFINTARREVAMRAQCVRTLTNSSGSIETATVTAGGTGYTVAPTVAITAPDFPSGTAPFPNGSQATATATISGGAVNAVNIVYGGSGYWQPLITFSGGGGTGAAATAVTSPVNALAQGKEVYNFSDIDLTQVPGAGAVYYVRSVSIIYANYRYSLPMYSFSAYQAQVRQYPFQYQYVPAFASQFGQGTAGSLYLYPIASQAYQYELDCLCLPQDLLTDLSVEIIPDPWVDAVKYFALHLAYLDIQNFNAATMYLQLFDSHLLRYSQYARIGRAINQYGRY